MMSNEQAERTAMSLTQYIYAVDTAPTFEGTRKYQMQLLAIRGYIRGVFGVNADVNGIIYAPEGGYYRDFHGEEVELTYQANTTFRLPGEDDILAEVAVGYGTDGFTHCEVAYY